MKNREISQATEVRIDQPALIGRQPLDVPKRDYFKLHMAVLAVSYSPYFDEKNKEEQANLHSLAESLGFSEQFLKRCIYVGGNFRGTFAEFQQQLPSASQRLQKQDVANAIKTTFEILHKKPEHSVSSVARVKDGHFATLRREVRQAERNAASGVKKDHIFDLIVPVVVGAGTNDFERAQALGIPADLVRRIIRRVSTPNESHLIMLVSNAPLTAEERSGILEAGEAYRDSFSGKAAKK